jgi:hypothetical protein
MRFRKELSHMEKELLGLFRSLPKFEQEGVVLDVMTRVVRYRMKVALRPLKEELRAELRTKDRRPKAAR